MGDRPWNDDDDDNRPEPPDLQRFYHQLNQLHTEPLRIRRSITILGVFGLGLLVLILMALRP
jgi:hypothetical protein